MPIKVRLATSLRDGEQEISEITLDVDTILFEDSRLLLLRDGEVNAELPTTAIREIELPAVPSSYIDEVRARHPKAYTGWTAEEKEQLLELHESGMSAADIAKRLGRQLSAVRSRLKKLLASPVEPTHPDAIDN